MQVLGSDYDALQYDAAFFSRQLPIFQIMMLCSMMQHSSVDSYQYFRLWGSAVWCSVLQ